MNPNEAHSILYRSDDTHLTADAFLKLAERVLRQHFDRLQTARALQNTVNICAWDHHKLVGCVRILSDGYFFSTLPDILIHPDYPGQEILSELLLRACEISPTSLFIGAQPGHENLFLSLGFKQGLEGYYFIKPLPHANSESEME
ncbi:GNAT family N-acetyltransferase [bacterium (Candidatus Blackallbacteria) CG17_big_fil_post_rev_8_21_14_2_50_48_46]|uniref:GNAT family N-acetyltransferase n=1 Tax=bacterium (Candidatus Blackallbacteria) CG17_big_fil_post_rev_8_21_14_2_50_48_46 TaxID=2014261 RepID=A0A2M7G6X6_9BACT|nr:MAG: GNAT family N-acetyltransferase [bacterium (Candidatus Blackallbacteria) CG18_big_fil_WC_8_21_14_2_50_49_26]PIW17666.1 MAG: GNAT family N-acetyltransferase [bacterium (Candidatus Blackallbacteria) CG17_big_fil_post_rev_8_21_14_2_50_48_46]PIW50115.1 MAG: GNAT family N-acetyltransferase [bacterium (Candidatus Blackallbacteria) CG13_big_fil_rev_8_21_14_2_50_49_14]